MDVSSIGGVEGLARAGTRTCSLKEGRVRLVEVSAAIAMGYGRRL